MIPGLLHGRSLVAGPAGGVIGAPAYQKLLAYQTGTSQAAATAIFKVKPDGVWVGDGTGYATQSGSWYNPATVGAGNAYEVRITPTNTGGVLGVVTNDAAGWVALSAERQLQVAVQRFTDGSTIAYYRVTVEIRLTGGAIVSTNAFDLTATAQVAAAVVGGGGCPSVEMWLGAGLTVGAAGAGQVIDAVMVYAPPTIARLAILGIDVSLQPCYRITASNGAAYVGSETTPFTLRDGASVFIADMLGREVLRDDGCGGLAWDVVATCNPVGLHLVAKLSVGGHSLLSGENPLMRIVSHNQAKF